jgi:hypothetical protein
MSGLSPGILFPLFFVILGLVLLFIFFRNLAKVRASQGWPAVQGTVIESWVRRSQSTDSDGSVSHSYYPEIRYLYQVMGSEYQGDKIAFGPKTGGSRSRAEKAIAKYPAGANVMVYYQPDKPAKAVLERTISKVSLVMGIAFVLAGIFTYVRWG